MKIQRERYPYERQANELGYVDWHRAEEYFTECKSQNRVFSRWRVPVGCLKCGSERMSNFSDAKRMKTALCHDCSASYVCKDRATVIINRLQCKNAITTPQGAVVLWPQTYYEEKRGRRYSYVPLQCVCGAVSQTKTSTAKLPGFSGLCGKCGTVYKAWLQHKEKPRKYFSEIYVITNVARGEFGEEMASFQSVSSRSKMG